MGAPMMQLRGGKLDSARRAAYTEELEVDWEIARWGRWTVTGRVLPERCDVSVARVKARSVSTAGRVEIDIQVSRSHVVANCAVEKTDPSILELADIVRTTLAFPIDYIAVRNRGAYELVLDVCIRNETGEAQPIPVAEPLFDGSGDGLCFDTSAESSSLLIPYEAASRGPELPTALHDLTEAVRYPRRTFEYCRMAVEAVRKHFDPPEIHGHKARHIAGEKALCAALKIERGSLINLERVAARSRHGDLIVSIDWQMRKRAMELAWELVARFGEYLQGGDGGGWRILDIEVEE